LNLRNNASDTADFSGSWIWQTRALFDFDQDDNAVVTFDSPTFKGMGEFTVGSSITGAATFDDVDPVIYADTGADLDGSVFKNQNGSHALEMVVGAMDIADMRFESYASKHAILIDTAGTYNFDNVFFDQSGTNDIETTHSSGVVTINITNGGTVPTVTETGAGTVVINNNVDLTVTVLDDSTGLPIASTAHVMILKESDKSELLNSAVNGSGVATDTFNYSTDVDVVGWAREMSLSGTDYVQKDFSGTITSGGFSTIARLTPLT